MWGGLPTSPDGSTSPTTGLQSSASRPRKALRRFPGSGDLRSTAHPLPSNATTPSYPEIGSTKPRAKEPPSGGFPGQRLLARDTVFPENALEYELVCEIADARWRKRHLSRLDAGLTAASVDETRR